MVDVKGFYEGGGRWDSRTCPSISLATIAHVAMTQGVRGLERFNIPPRIKHYNAVTRELQLCVRLTDMQVGDAKTKPVASTDDIPSRSAGQAPETKPVKRLYKTASKEFFDEMHGLVEQFYARKEDGTFVRYLSRTLDAVSAVGRLSACL